VSARRALVTGGTRGIGEAIAARLVADGLEVTVTGSTVDSRQSTVFDFAAVDFSDRAATEEFASSGLEFDVLVNNAGINKIAPFAEIDPADFDRIQEVNVRAPMLLCRAVLPHMRSRGWGRIVNVSSIFGVISREQRASYSTSKFGLDGLTAALAAEVAADGILANCVAPGFVDTDLTRRVLGEDGMRELAEAVPARRLAKPEEIAAFVAWLAGPENTYVSGQNMVIDGGFSRI
jgi:NAD(P)-dependent dehydrogenase (short-subunit alcohol dehydrogenase family)